MLLLDSNCSSRILKYFFILEIQIEGTCPGTYDDYEQEIRSPNYPRNYHDREVCTWKLKAPQGRHIELRFLDFDLEKDNTCRYDWLKVHNGGSRSSTLIRGKLCGSIVPSKIVSYGNQLFLEFHADGDGSYTGFKISYNLQL